MKTCGRERIFRRSVVQSDRIKDDLLILSRRPKGAFLLGFFLPSVLSGALQAEWRAGEAASLLRLIEFENATAAAAPYPGRLLWAGLRALMGRDGRSATWSASFPADS
jgi:hypothetical protein